MNQMSRKHGRDALSAAITFALAAAAFVQAAAMPDAEAWRRGVAETFQAIVTREGITPRHAALRRVKSRFREHVEPLVRRRP